MKKLLLLLILFAIAASATPLPDKSYFITLHYKDGAITVKNVTVQYGYAPDRINQPTSGYKLILADRHGTTIYISFFPVQTQIEAPMTKEGKWSPWIARNDFDFTVQLPYYTEGGTIDLLDPQGVPIKHVDVTKTSQCNQNNICDGREAFETCSDCTPGQKGPIKKFLTGEKLTATEADLADLPLEGTIGAPARKGAGKTPSSAGTGGILGSKLVWIILAIAIIIAIVLKRRAKKDRTSQK